MSVARMLPSPVLSSSRPRTCSIRMEPSPLRATTLPSRGIVTISFAVGDSRPTPKKTISCEGFFTSISMRSPSCFVSIFNWSMASWVWPRFSISTTTVFASPDRISIAPSKVVRCKSAGPVTVNRFSSRAICPCESTTTQPARLNGMAVASRTVGSTDFIQCLDGNGGLEVLKFQGSNL